MNAVEQLERIIAEGTNNGFNSRRPFTQGKPSNKLVCTDGFTVSVIAGEGTYCRPRPSSYGSGDVPGTFAGPYTSVEVGYPSTRPEPWDDVWKDLAETPDDPTGTVYGYVPVDMVRALIAVHEVAS